MFKKNLVVTALLLGWCQPLQAEEAIFQTSEVVSMQATNPTQDWSFFIGGGGNVGLSNNTVLDAIAGGTVKTRLTYRHFISLETSLDFNRFPVKDVDEGSYRSLGLRAEADGDLFSVPLVPMILIHAPGWDNLTFYALGGVGYQWNDPDKFEVDVRTTAGNSGTFDVDVEDGSIGVAGGGFDVVLTNHLLLNFDVRYQFAEFDTEVQGSVGGVSFQVKEKEENFDSVHLRVSLLYRF